MIDSITAQTAENWEHIVMVDVPLVFDKAKQAIIDSLPKDTRRRIIRCGKPHRNYGNTCRHNAWKYATGEYILYLDDDDYLADDRVLETLDTVVKPWAVFPIRRCGEFWLQLPPGMLKTGNGMFIAKREIAQFPDLPDYCADGLLVENLKKYEYEVVDGRPLMIYEQRGLGRE